MDHNDKETKRVDGIVSLEEVRKKKEREEIERKEIESSNEVLGKMIDKLFSNLDSNLKSQLKDMLTSYGMKLSEEERVEVEKLLESKQLQMLFEDIQLENLMKPFDPQENIEKAKRINRKYESYRNFFQWRTVYKPYTLDKFLLHADLKKICKELGLEVKEKHSVNEMIGMLEPHLPVWIDRQIRYYDSSRMNHIANLIYHEGVYRLSMPLSDEQSAQMDYFESKYMIFRVSDSGVKSLVMPKEILETIYHMDFTKYNILTECNTIATQFIIGIANSYGVYPLDKALDTLFEHFEKNYGDYWKSFEQFQEHMSRLIKSSFGNMFLWKSYYPGINVSEDYIYHGTVGFAEQFLEMQEESDYEYKELDFQEILRRGESLYYEDSIHLNRAFEILKEENYFTEKDEKNIKNLIYVFSKLEFTPNMLLIFLESMYILPKKQDYEKLLSSLKKVSEATEKWVLKGHFIKKESECKIDTSKVINIDFCSQRNGKQED